MIDSVFCELLEHRITAALQNSSDQQIRSYWCDGVLLPTFENEYSKKHVNDNRSITVTGFMGVDGQDKYEIVLLFGRTALSRYARGLDVSDCIPDCETMGGFTFDIFKKQVLIELL